VNVFYDEKKKLNSGKKKLKFYPREDEELTEEKADEILNSSYAKKIFESLPESNQPE